MKKEEALKIILDCARLYRDNLVNKNVLFIFCNTNTQGKGECLYIETLFLPRNFLHLTGVKILNSNITSGHFYELSVNHKLSIRDFEFAKNGTTTLKLKVLTSVMQIHKNTKMIGNYDNTKSILYTEKIAGNINACMGFVKDNNYYIPNTILKEDIRNITIKPIYKVMGTLIKNIKEDTYSTITYLNKSICKDDLLKVLVENRIKFK